MIPKISRGDEMRGLVSYLAGPGKANEHTEPHVVAADSATFAMYGEGELSHASALALARHLERPSERFGVEVKGGHVWHCSLSLAADEGQLSDTRWQEIASEFVRRMGFDDADDPRMPCRWVAVRHGVSKNGNDHVHIAVNVVREDGTKASLSHDWTRAQAAARALEQEHGLVVLTSRDKGRGVRAWNSAEEQAQMRNRARARYESTRAEGAPRWHELARDDRESRLQAEARIEPGKRSIERRLRAAATASSSEDEFVRRARGSGLAIRPRFASGRDDVVLGYSVAERGAAGERLTWYGGGSIAKDLTLPRLRELWPDSPGAAVAATGEWRAAWRGQPVTYIGPEGSRVDDALWTQTGDELHALADRLQHVDPRNRAEWQQVARETSGVLAAWSGRVERDQPGPIAHAANVLGESGSTDRRDAKPYRRQRSLTSAALLFTQAAGVGGEVVGYVMVAREVMRLAETIARLHRADQEARHAARIERAFTDQHWHGVATSYEAHRIAQAAKAVAPAVDANDPTSVLRIGRPAPGSTAPVPPKVDPTQRPRTPHSPTNPTRGREGPDR